MSLYVIHEVRLDEPKIGFVLRTLVKEAAALDLPIAKDEEACEMPKWRREAASLLEGVTDRVV